MASVSDRLVRKIGQEAAPDGFGGRVKDFPGQIQVLAGRESQEISDKAAVVLAGSGAGPKDPAHVQEETWESSAASAFTIMGSPGVQA